MRGDAGDNTLWGYGSRDYLSGYGGNDRLEGGAGDDVLSAGAGDDILNGGSGADRLSGGTGFDFADYGGAGGVTADLSDVSLNTGDAAGDVYNSIEGLLGSAETDILSGDGFDNAIFGGQGDDKLAGRNGNDTLDGGYGKDYLSGGAGADELRGGEGFDFADYSDALSVRVDLADPSQNTSIAAGDSYSAIEGLIGSDGRDSLRGDAGDNVIIGGGSTDFISGRDGNDRLFGGEGNDYIWGNAGADVFVFDRGDGYDQVRDFDATQDSLEFLFDFAPEDFFLIAVSGGVEVDYGDGIVFLRNFSLDDWTMQVEESGSGFVLTFI